MFCLFSCSEGLLNPSECHPLNHDGVKLQRHHLDPSKKIWWIHTLEWNYLAPKMEGPVFFFSGIPDSIYVMEIQLKDFQAGFQSHSISLENFWVVCFGFQFVVSVFFQKFFFFFFFGFCSPKCWGWWLVLPSVGDGARFATSHLRCNVGVANQEMFVGMNVFCCKHVPGIKYWCPLKEGSLRLVCLPANGWCLW